jgi:hypothetical protein
MVSIGPHGSGINQGHMNLGSEVMVSVDLVHKTGFTQIHVMCLLILEGMVDAEQKPECTCTSI